MDLWNDLSGVDGKRFARAMARAYPDDPQVQDLFTVIHAVGRVSDIDL